MLKLGSAYITWYKELYYFTLRVYAQMICRQKHEEIVNKTVLQLREEHKENIMSLNQEIDQYRAAYNDLKGRYFRLKDSCRTQ